MSTFAPTPDPQETSEWLDALRGVHHAEGATRVGELLANLTDEARKLGVEGLVAGNSGAALTTPYINTIPLEDQPAYPGDLVFFQGHSSPGIYARAFLEGRIDESQLLNFRQETGGHGLSSYPHPWLMPDFWQFPTVSMGLAPIMSIYQARFMKYLDHRGHIQAGNRKVWAFLGDGEMDEVESLGAIGLGARESLDNLVWVINCNLQRLDGPVRGNGKIIQELEGIFRGAGWNVIKLIWGKQYDPLLAADSSGRLRQLMQETIDGDYQSLRAGGAKTIRERFFGKYPETAALVEGWSDADFMNLKRGGHDPEKIYAAYARATATVGKPTVILAKTIKGYGMGDAGEAMNIAHQAKKLDLEHLRYFRDRFNIPIPDAKIEEIPFFTPPKDSPEMQYVQERTAALGNLPQRRRGSVTLAVPDLPAFDAQLQSSQDREISTTMAFVRILSTILRDKEIGPRVVPIVADESRTFGMEGLFRQIGIYSPTGQHYLPQDAGQLMWYREDAAGQILQEGINEAGALCSWIAAGTSYSNHDVPMVPFYIFYSMFGFQRIGDLAWAAGDIRTRGFLIGGTAGRTTLNGEGLQHEDGHSHLIASTIPNCVAYDPAYGYELAVIIQDGLRRMLTEHEDIYYYLTVMNENYVQPAMPKGAEEGILRGMYLLQSAPSRPKAARVQLLGSGTILREVLAAAAMLKDDFDVDADIWSVTSFTQLRRDGIDCERYNLLHPEQPPRRSYVGQALAEHPGPVVASTDYIRTHADQIRPYIDRRYTALGTDGFGRSDRRKALRAFFEVDRRYIALAALRALADDGTIDRAVLSKAITRYELDPNKPNPVTV